MKVIFLGYPKGVKGYRQWLINKRKVVITRDVIFNEKIFFKTNLQVPIQTQYTNNFQFEVENDRLSQAPGGNDIDLPVGNLEDDQLREGVGITSDADEAFQDDTKQNDQVTASYEQEGGQNLRHYMLARDRARREIRPPQVCTC